MQISFREESWFDCRKDMEWLFPLHWNEVGSDRDIIPLDIDYDFYDATAKAGNFQVVTIRDGEKCVGYHWSFVRTHPRYRTTLFAFTDVYFLHPDYRKGRNGIELFKAVEKIWQAKGVFKAVTESKFKLDKSPIFEHLGWYKAEVTYMKVL